MRPRARLTLASKYSLHRNHFLSVNTGLLLEKSILFLNKSPRSAGDTRPEDRTAEFPAISELQINPFMYPSPMYEDTFEFIARSGYRSSAIAHYYILFSCEILKFGKRYSGISQLRFKKACACLYMYCINFSTFYFFPLKSIIKLQHEFRNSFNYTFVEIEL